jgi:hypothetical protein
MQLLVDGWRPNMTIRSLDLPSSAFDSSGLQILLGVVASGRMPLQELDLVLFDKSGRLLYDGLQIIGEALPSLNSCEYREISCAIEGSRCEGDPRPERILATFD